MTTFTPSKYGSTCALWLCSASPSSGPSFDPWITPSDPTYVYRAVIDPPDDPYSAPDPDFIGEQY